MYNIQKCSPHEKIKAIFAENSSCTTSSALNSSLCTLLFQKTYFATLYAIVCLYIFFIFSLYFFLFIRFSGFFIVYAHIYRINIYKNQYNKINISNNHLKRNINYIKYGTHT